MSNINTQYYKSPYGELILGSIEDSLCLCDWRYRKAREKVDQRLKNILKADFQKQNSPVIDETITQLKAYFDREIDVFDIPVRFAGTDFQQSVWEILTKIPYGKTSSYQDMAKSMGNPKAVRAVANANGANAMSIIVPCHRIIGSDGSLTGYAGGLDAKLKLLTLEQALI